MTSRRAETPTDRKPYDQLTYEEVSAYMNSVVKFPDVYRGMDTQIVKQINGANAKMANALRVLQRGSSLTIEQQKKLAEWVRFVDQRIGVAVQERPDVDFKSCDSAGIALGQQILRTEEHCDKLPKNDDDDY